jgi:O-antigen/teichoic acid export membrane protein
VEATANVAVGIATAVAVVFMFALHSSLMSYLVLFALSSVAYWLYAARMLKKLQLTPQHGIVEPELMKSLKSHLIWTMVLTFVGAFSNKSIETYLLNLLTGPAEVGYFTIAVALTRGGVELLSSGLTTVLMPLLAHAYGAGGNDRVGLILPRTVRYFHFLGLFIAGAGVFLAKPVVIFMYGNQYQAVIDILRIMMLTSGLTLSTGAFGALLSITDHQRARAGFAIFTLIVNIVAAIALIPNFGLAGAVMAQAISRALGFIAMVITAKSIMPLRLEIKLLFNLTLAAVLAGALASALYFQLPDMVADVVATTVFAIIYFGLTIYMRTWQREDVQLLVSIVSRLPRKFQFLLSPLIRWEKSFDQA